MINGIETTWFPNGQKRYEGHHHKGNIDGKWTWWDDDGDLLLTRQYNKGILMP